MKNLEIELRGQLTKEEFDKANSFFALNGKLLEVQDREMMTLYELPGFDADITKREIDVRIRVTNGLGEIMVKRKASSNNDMRIEKSYPFGECSISDMKEFVKIFGVTKGNWMHRKKHVYDYDGVEWSLVEANPDIYYYEAEMLIQDESEFHKSREVLQSKIETLGYKIFTDDEYKDFIKLLNEKVNKKIEW